MKEFFIEFKTQKEVLIDTPFHVLLDSLNIFLNRNNQICLNIIGFKCISKLFNLWFVIKIP